MDADCELYTLMSPLSIFFAWHLYLALAATRFHCSFTKSMYSSTCKHMLVSITSGLYVLYKQVAHHKSGFHAIKKRLKSIQEVQ